MAPIPALSGRLSDGVVELRAISEWDIPEILIAHQDDPGLHAALGEARPPTGAQLGAEVERDGAERDAGLAVRLTIVDPGREDCLGRIVVSPIEWPQASGPLTLWVAPDRRGQGVGGRALALAAGWLLGDAGLHRLTIDAPPGATALRAAARAAGFTDPDSDRGGDDLSPQPGRLELER